MIQNLIDDAALGVRFAEGTTQTLCVSFTGIHEGLGGASADEFVGSLVPHSVMFVSDRTRSWYNAPGLADRIIDTVAASAKKLGADRIVTIGNSMGGFGALTLAGELAAETAIAFAPQFAIRSDLVPFETRWREHAALVSQWRYPTARISPSTSNFIFSGTAPEEVSQTSLFPHSLPNLSIFRVEGGHAIAGELKTRGILRMVIHALLDNDASLAGDVAVRRLLRAEGLGC